MVADENEWLVGLEVYVVETFDIDVGANVVECSETEVFALEFAGKELVAKILMESAAQKREDEAWNVAGFVGGCLAD